MTPFFTYPWALALLLLLPWLAWKYRARSRGAWQFPDQRLVPIQPGGRPWWAGWGGLCLRLAGLGLAIVALAGPRWPDPSSRIPAEGIAIAMVVDVSTSMSEQDCEWENTKITRLEGVKRVFRLFVAGGLASQDVELKGRPQDLLALITFATHPDTVCPLTLDHPALLKIMEAQEPRTAAGEGTTNPGDALAWALHVLQEAPTRRKVILYLTDGESNVEKLKTTQVALLAANLSVPIYAIDASPVSIKPEQIEEARKTSARMQTVARMTDGRYFRAQDGKGLVQAYESIDRLERDRILSFQYRRYHEGAVWFALAALACWLGLIGAESTWWRTVP